ncbi:hypothetical protein AB0M36_17160 [Actinoplanes sp. NPDC051346]|uniref:hypothetical protein n=1 Tax=Actinoplanes sp. NPDC051346 TaxID=3155048 RepID=UPI0034314250
MGLAILNVDDVDDTQVRFGIDTGTNPWYQLRFGRKKGQRDGFDEVDDVVHTTALARNPKAGWTFDSHLAVRIPTAVCRSARYAQLLSFKDERGTSPALSRPMELGLGGRSPTGDDLGLAMTTTAFHDTRVIPCRTLTETFSLPPGLGDLLGQLVKLAGPVVADLLKPGSAAVAPAAPAAPGTIVAELLRTILGAVASPAPAGVSAQQSLVRPRISGPTRNRFAGAPFARAQIFGIDDALIASLIGPIIQVLPQLVNAAAQEKIQLRQANNKLITDLMSGLDRRRMMELLSQARAASPGNPALAALTGLFEGEAAAAAAPPPTTSQSLAYAPAPPPAANSKAALTFVLAPPQEWYGEQRNLFRHGSAIGLRLRLEVGRAGPGQPLPKAIAHVVVKDATERVLHQQDFRLLAVEPGTPLLLALESGDISHLPRNTPLTVAAQVRWPGSRPRTAFQAAAVAEIVLVDPVFVKSLSGPVDGDRELVDMQTFRPFWNKVWESPVLQSASAEEGSSRWSLEAAMKYSVLFSPTQPSNGLMETRAMTAVPDGESAVARTEGRFKGGIELSVGEVNKLLPLWTGQQPLPPEVLQALATQEFARRTAGEVVQALRLKGGKRERGMIWVVPVFNLREIRLGSVDATDDAGQVTTVSEQQARFPVPCAVRVLAMKSDLSSRAYEEDETAEATEPAYTFAGFEIVSSEKVALTPPTEGPRMVTAAWTRPSSR